MSRKKIHLIYSIIAGLLVIASGIGLIVSCLSIYHSGDRPYSPDSIAQQFQKISLLVYTTVIAVLGGIVLKLVLPDEKKRPKAETSPWMQLQRLRKKAVSLTDSYATTAAKERSHRLSLMISVGTTFAALMIYPLFYLGNLSHFTVENLNGDVIRALAISMIPAILGLCLCLLCRHWLDKSIMREIGVWKEAISAGAYSAEAQPVSNKLSWIRAAIFLLAAVLIIVGIFNGGATDVLLKAIAICTECIGLG